MTHTVTLETARKLKEAGLFKGRMSGRGQVEMTQKNRVIHSYYKPILSELLEVLPKALTTGGRDYRLNVLYENNKCYLGYYDFEQVCYPISNSEHLFVAHVHDCEAAALLILKLIENKIPLAK